MSNLLFDFTDASAVQTWTAIDDRVMGGVLRSSLEHDPAGHAVFKGSVCLERNGGFASVRTSPADRRLPRATECAIEVRGGGKQFKLSLLTDDGFDSLNYQASFKPNDADWQSIILPITAFRASFRGREVPGAPALDIRRIGLASCRRAEGAPSGAPSVAYKRPRSKKAHTSAPATTR